MWPLPDKEDRFIKAMMDSRGENKEALDREVLVTLRAVRLQRAFAPWLQSVAAFSGYLVLAWRMFRGRYWKTAAQAHGGANQASGPGAGAGSLAALSPGPNFSFPSGAGTAATSLGSFTFTVAPAFTDSDPVENAGIRAGEIVGYRCWRLDADGLLRSMFESEFVWRPGEIVEGDPSKGRAGVHAFKDPLAVGSYGYSYDPGNITVSGTVHLWGTVIEHERGWRASHAAIASINASPNYDAKALRRKYGLTKRRGKKK